MVFMRRIYVDLSRGYPVKKTKELMFKMIYSKSGIKIKMKICV